jgi:hypothetical protein
MLNYYCNGLWFEKYSEASLYANILLNNFRVYKAIYTRSEIEAHLKEETQ